MKRWLPLILFTLTTALALSLRAPKLSLKPMHGDEAINAYKFNDLRTTGKYIYDPHEYHGPTLPYVTTVAAMLDGRDYANSTESTYRAVTVFFGVALVAMNMFIRRGVGTAEALVAALLTAISPAMVFYSRYYIHEMLLVLFTFSAIAAGWRYLHTRHMGAALACGASLGLMHATKETWVIAVAAMVWAILLTFAWSRWQTRAWRIHPPLRWKVLVAAAVVALAASAVLFSGLGTNPRGPLDSILAYATYLERGAGNSDHNKPVHYYLQLLAWNKPGRASLLSADFLLARPSSPLWTEAFILLLALLGLIESLRPRRRAAAAPDDPESRTPNLEPSLWLLRFLAFYTLSLLFIYSVIRYKTPWCVLSILHGFILLAGVGAVAIVRWLPHIALKIPVTLLLAAGAVHQGRQSYQLNFNDRLVYAPSNPYTYSQPRTGYRRLIERIDQMSRLAPAGDKLPIALCFPNNDYWPLPWYLRKYPNLGYYAGPDALRAEAAPPAVLITQPGVSELMTEYLESRYRLADFFELRPGIVLPIYVEAGLWDAFIETRRNPKQ